MKRVPAVSLFRSLLAAALYVVLAAAQAFAGGVILHFSDFGPPEASSGSATVMKNLQDAQSKLGRKVFLVLPEFDAGRFPRYENPDNIIRIPRDLKFQSSPGYTRLRALFESGEVQAVHVHKEASFSRLGLSLARAYHVPAVLTAHMMIGPFLHDHFANKPRALRPVFDWLERKIERDYVSFANSFDVVTAPTEIVRDYLEGRGVSRPIVVIPPGGVPLERFPYSLKPDRAFLSGLIDVVTDPSNALERVAEGRVSGKPLAEAMGLEQPGRPRKIVVMLARLSTEKGIERVLESWKSARSDTAFDYQLVLAGLGGVNEDSRRIYEALKSHPEAGCSIHWVGSLSYEDVPKLLAGGDVIVNASRHETFGLAIVEAQAAGRPVIVPDLPAFRSILKDGENAIVVPEVSAATLAGALKRIFADNGATYERMSKAARENAELYSTATVNARTLTSYELAGGQQSIAGKELAAAGRYFATPLGKAELCRWMLVNLLTKP